jgi:hypothetical protein
LAAAFAADAADAEIAFTDVGEDDWYYSCVAKGVGLGLVEGYANGSFAPGDNITREDMAVILARLLARREADFSAAPKSFADEGEIAAYALEAAKNLSAIGVFGGDDNGAFRPKSDATRAEAAKTLYAAMEKGGALQ